MPVFKAQVFKTNNDTRFWTNVYHLEAVDLPAAAAFANTTIATAESTLLDGSIHVSKTIVSDPASDDFVTTPLNIPGAMSGVSLLPFYNTVKVNVSVAGFGRNDYKFYRGGLTEAGQTNGVLETALVAAYDAMVDGIIADGGAAGVDLVDNVGNLWLVAATQSNVQMRQLHRRRRSLGAPA